MHCDAPCALQSVKADASTVDLLFNDSIKQMQFDEAGAQTHPKHTTSPNRIHKVHALAHRERTINNATSTHTIHHPHTP